MYDVIEDTRSSCSSVSVDPKLSPATAAVEKLNKRMGLLSEMEKDFGHEICDVFYDLQYL